jgi:uncharacterized membrane protein YcaP (DUF421 family)
MGKREIGELEVGELITTLLISEICSIPIDDPDIPLLNAVIPVLFIVSVEIIISSVKNKSLRLKRMIDGSGTYLIYRGHINQSALKNNRISIEEFFSALRQNGIGRFDEIEYCILEANGKISVLKKNAGMEHIIISDGEINAVALRTLGYGNDWLQKRLGSVQAEKVFLMTVNEIGDTNILLKEEKR